MFAARETQRNAFPEDRTAGLAVSSSTTAARGRSLIVTGLRRTPLPVLHF